MVQEKIVVVNNKEFLQDEFTNIKDTEKEEIYQLYKYHSIALISNQVTFPKTEELDKRIGDKIESLSDLLENFSTNKPYSLWKDGSLYYVHYLAVNIETLEIYVIYQALYGNHNYHARLFDSFTAEIPKSRDEENTTNQKYRFEIKQ